MQYEHGMGHSITHNKGFYGDKCFLDYYNFVYVIVTY